MKVFYHNDLDGRCSAAIVHLWVGVKDCSQPFELISMGYDTEFPFDRVSAGEQVWIVDFSLKPDVMSKLLALTDDVTWIDHHRTAIEALKPITDSRPVAGYRSTDDAACVLTWKYAHWYSCRGSNGIVVADDTPCEPRGVHNQIPVPRSVEFLGDYDAWHHRLPDSTRFHEGCKLIPGLMTPGSDDWFDLLCGEAKGTYGDGTPLPSRDVCTPIIRDGAVAIRYRDAYCDGICGSYGFETVFDGLRVFVANIYGFGSLGFGDRMKSYDACAACVYNGSTWTVSLYTLRPDIDVGEFCRRHGGGGHRGAAGFVCSEFPFVRKTGQ